ncbi:MAG: DUF2252 domain-containing protein [Candidatus Dormibacteraeota bacterium]|nr:DUF2252 domain-containing protein [Candidatus Dormibacteraeota bacterium]
MNVEVATRSYEAWIARQTDVVRPDLAYKHSQMAAAPFPFMRATYYRWAEAFPEVCSALARAPRVLAVGDLHVENFGTWRDGEGRLVWGINDFDEAHSLPYTNDLVRLAASARLAIAADRVQIPFREACVAIEQGYRRAIEAGGRPILLEERHRALRKQALGRLRDPARFWAELAALPVSRGRSQERVLRVLNSSLPAPVHRPVLLRRRAGLGSLGHPRLVVMIEWDGALVAREAKASIGSATSWLTAPDDFGPPIFYERIVQHAVRCPDPFLRVEEGWIVRRLAPDCSRIELASVPSRKDQAEWLSAMGWEAANVHLGSSDSIRDVKADLRTRRGVWLREAAREMVDLIRRDQAEWAAAHLGLKSPG